MLKHRVVSVETSVEFLVYITDFEEHCRMVIADLSPHPIPTVCLQLSEDNCEIPENSQNKVIVMYFNIFNVQKTQGLMLQNEAELARIS